MKQYINRICANRCTRYRRLWVFRNWLGQGRGCPKGLLVLRPCYRRKYCRCSHAESEPRIVVPRVLPNFCDIRIEALPLRRVQKNDPSTLNRRIFSEYPAPTKARISFRAVLSLVQFGNSYLLTISKVFFHLFVQNKHLKQHKEKHG